MRKNNNFCSILAHRKRINTIDKKDVTFGRFLFNLYSITAKLNKRFGLIFTGFDIEHLWSSLFVAKWLQNTGRVTLFFGEPEPSYTASICIHKKIQNTWGFG